MRNYLSLIKFGHTIFALPFALLGLFLAVISPGGQFSWRSLILVLLCMVFARSAAMAFNRFLDRDIDSRNPRTAVRELPAGIIKPKSALIFVIINSFLFIGASWFINSLCFYLSPIALLIILGYSYTKRFTWMCHFILGLGLSLAPIGAYLAILGRFDFLPLLYSGAVLFWVAGFDIIYALQDEEFDKDHNLYSIPSWIGKKNALLISTIAHLISSMFIIVATVWIGKLFPQMGLLNWMAGSVFIILLYYQHRLVKPNDLSKVNLAFFTTNGIASMLFCCLVIIDLYF